LSDTQREVPHVEGLKEWAELAENYARACAHLAKIHSALRVVAAAFDINIDGPWATDMLERRARKVMENNERMWRQLKKAKELIESVEWDAEDNPKAQAWLSENPT